ncbi:hypothetical protein COCVIDRAFT_115245 [Bipolaris victoriae FI3]|uniref:Uncharacterized protein n=1 Tax=Bipolaris victoriae (strain FI3) TaxID=930091 RepID=W7E4K4_BIPV3|nr:hypothetical protein COCVIDRAFT_115245 [Bipolaris victoriae FI3]
MSTNLARTTLLQEREEILRDIAELAAETERRSLMTPEEKSLENGLRLRGELESKPALAILLHPTPPTWMARARCRADYCSFAECRVIKEEYRIVFDTVPRVCFHVSCIEKMLDLPSLAPARFKLDTDCYRWNRDWPWTWGLMLQKWFEHGGCINLHKIARYFKAYIRYEREVSKHDAAWIQCQLAQ